MAARFRRRREDTQELIAQLEALAAIEAHFQQARFLVQLDLGRDLWCSASRPAIAVSAQNSTDHDSANQLASAVLYAA
jgi:hypothetical protein